MDQVRTKEVVMEKLDIKKLAKKETKAKVTAYALIVGTILVLYTLSMIGKII